MPRIARKSLESTFFHIIVQGIEKKYIFNKNTYKKKYLDLLFKEKEKYEVNIIAYCIMDNHAHILINVNTIKEMSKFMHRVNTNYAMYYNYMENDRVGYVFRNRFLSEPIFNEMYLLNCIKYIHNNPLNASIVNSPELYPYSSFNDYKRKKGVALNKVIHELIDMNEVCSNTDSQYVFLDIDANQQKIVEKVIKQYEIKYEIMLPEIKKNKYILKKMISELKENYRINYVIISKITRNWIGNHYKIK